MVIELSPTIIFASTATSLFAKEILQAPDKSLKIQRSPRILAAFSRAFKEVRTFKHCPRSLRRTMVVR
jgi:hypothetical protein